MARRPYIFNARKRQLAAQNFTSYKDDIASPVDLGSVAAGNDLSAYTTPAGSRLAVSFSNPITAGQLTVAIGANTLGIPDLAADEVRRLDWAENTEQVVINSAIAGTVTLYVLNQWQEPFQIATGVFT